MNVTPRQTEAITDGATERAVRRIDNRIDQNAVPVGAAMFWAGDSDTLPPGWIALTGQPLRSQDYPELIQVMGARWPRGATTGGVFYAPDTRGHGIPGVMDAVIVKAK